MQPFLKGQKFVAYSKLKEPYSYAGVILQGWLSANFDRQ